MVVFFYQNLKMYKCILCPTEFSTVLEMKRHADNFYSSLEVYYSQQWNPNCLRSFFSSWALYRHLEASHVLLPVIAISKANNVEPHGHEISAYRESVDQVTENESDVDLDELQIVQEFFFSELTLQRKNANKLVNLAKHFLTKIFNTESFYNLSTER